VFLGCVSSPLAKRSRAKKQAIIPSYFFARHVFAMDFILGAQPRHVINDLLESVFFVDFAMAPD
jgi:hypothetical protein